MRVFLGSKAVKRRFPVPLIDKDTPILTVTELKRLLTVLASLFDVARIVNPHDTAILSIKDDGRDAAFGGDDPQSPLYVAKCGGQTV